MDTRRVWDETHEDGEDRLWNTGWPIGQHGFRSQARLSNKRRAKDPFGNYTRKLIVVS